jgi:hypothetical protein
VNVGICGGDAVSVRYPYLVWDLRRGRAMPGG